MHADRPAPKTPHGSHDRDSIQRRVADAVGALEQAAREILAAEQRIAPEAKVDAVELPVVLGFYRGQAGGDTRLAAEIRLAESEKLVELLRGRVRDALLNAVAFQRGRVYCLRCENSLCAHSSPPTSRSVFSGYEETGRPEWIELDKLLHRKGDPRIERLYGGRDLVALTLHRDELYGRLFEGFDAPKWRCYVLGQLCVGYFVPNGEKSAAPARPEDRWQPERRPRERGELMALTVQVVRTEKAPEGAMLGLNLVGRRPELAGGGGSSSGGGGNLSAGVTSLSSGAAALDETILEGLPDALRHLRRETGVFSGRGGSRVPGIGVALERLVNRVANLLRDASRDLEHRTRMDGRRTGHARDRARQGDRPTHKAFEDARAAGDTDLFWDVQENTVVVVGPSNRVHFFGIDGRQVTSVVFPGHVIQQRVNQQRWAPIDAEKRARFRRGVDMAAAGGDRGGGAAGPESGARSDAPK
jgi:hypothetical protein